MELMFIVPTSIIFESLFFTAGHVLNDRRRGTLQGNGKMHLFLYLTCDLSGVEELHPYLISIFE